MWYYRERERDGRTETKTAITTSSLDHTMQYYLQCPTQHFFCFSAGGRGVINQRPAVGCSVLSSKPNVFSSGHHHEAICGHVSLPAACLCLPVSYIFTKYRLVIIFIKNKETYIFIYLNTVAKLGSPDGDRILRHCSRRTTRGHASPIPLYHLSKPGA